jgi:hypothetical protein
MKKYTKNNSNIVIMAITRLTDIVTVFENKWTYGDVSLVMMVR